MIDILCKSDRCVKDMITKIENANTFVDDLSYYAALANPFFITAKYVLR